MNGNINGELVYFMETLYVEFYVHAIQSLNMIENISNSISIYMKHCSFEFQRYLYHLHCIYLFILSWKGSPNHHS